MKKSFFILFLVLSFLFLHNCKKSEVSSHNSPNSQNTVQNQTSERGEQIITECLKRDFAPFRQSQLRFTITSENEPPTVYEVEIWRKQTENSTLTMSHIIKPAQDNDLSSLINETKGQETIVTNYVTSSDQFRDTNTNKSFFGGVPTQELIGEWSKYKFNFIGEKELNDVKVFELEGKLIINKNTQADKISGFFRTDNYLPLELHLFDKSGKELRTFFIKDYQTEGNHTYISKTEIENHIFKTHLIVEVLSLNYPNKIDDSIFTRDQLKKFANK